MFGKLFGWATRPALHVITNGSQATKNLPFAAISMHLVGQLSNPSTVLEVVLEASAVVRPGPRDSRESIVVGPASRRLGNGVVQLAVAKVLVMAGRPMRVTEVHLAVEQLLGHSVSKHSVSWSLAADARSKGARFERTTRGCYQIRR
jgi:hypothetical protein